MPGWCSLKLGNRIAVTVRLCLPPPSIQTEMSRFICVSPSHRGDTCRVGGVKGQWWIVYWVFHFTLPSTQPFLCAQITAMGFVLPNVCTCSKLNSNWMTNFLTAEAPLITMCKSHWLRLGYNGCKIDTDHDRVVRFGGPGDNQFGALKWDSSCFILQPAVGSPIWPSCAGPSGSIQVPESLVLSQPQVQGNECQPPIIRWFEHLIYLISSLWHPGAEGTAAYRYFFLKLWGFTLRS